MIDTDTPTQCLNKIVAKAKSYGKNMGVMDTHGLKLVEDGWPHAGRMLADLDEVSGNLKECRNLLRVGGCFSRFRLARNTCRGPPWVSQTKSN